MGGNRSSSRRRLFLIIGVVLVVLTIILGIVSSLGSSTTGKASAVSKQMIIYIGQGNGVSSYELFSPQGKQSTGKEEWVTFVVANKSAVGEKLSPKLVYTKIIDDSTTEEAYNIGESGSIYRIKIFVNTRIKLIESVEINRTSL